MHSYLLQGLIQNGDLDVASQIVLDLLQHPIDCPFPTPIQHGFPEPEVLIGYLVKTGRTEDAEVILGSLDSRSMPAIEAFVHATASKHGLEALRPFGNQERNDSAAQSLGSVRRHVAATTALLQKSGSAQSSTPAI